MMCQNHPVIALVQHPPVFINLQASMDKACTLIEEAANHPADLVVFPENVSISPKNQFKA